MEKQIVRYHKLIDSLIELNRENRELLPDDIRLMSDPCKFAAEYCTVKCDIGRNTGKTEYIKRRSKKTDAIVACNGFMMDRYCGDEVGATIFAPFELRFSRCKKIKPYEVIYIDGPIDVFMQLDKNRIYEIFASADIDQTFVFLGM